MKLLRLEINHMPGFEQRPLALHDLGAGLNIIVGPNASGKTTACRAIAALLWPDNLKNVPDARITSYWQDGGGIIQIEARGARRSCSRDGAAIDLPALPPLHFLRSYIITLDDLFESGGAYDARLAQAVLREMAGGFDLPSLRELSFMSVSYKGALAAAKALAEERRAVAAERQAQSALRREEAGLPALRREYEQACRAAEELELTAAASQLRELDRAVSAAESSLAGFPAAVGRLTGGEVKRLEELKKDRDAKQQLLAAEESRLRRLQAELDGLGLPPESACLPDLEIGRELLEQLRRNAERSALISHQSAQKRGELGDSAAASQELPADEEQTTDAARLARMAGLQRRWEAAAHEQKLLNTEIAFLEKQHQSARDQNQEALHQGVLLLRRWLRAPSPEETGSLFRMKSLLVMLALLIAALTAYLAVRTNPWWLLLEVVPAGIAAALLRSRRHASDSRVNLRALYEALPLARPSGWEAPAVEFVLEELEQEIQRCAAALQAQQRSARMAARLMTVNQEMAALEKERAAAAAELGQPADTPVFGLPLFAERLAKRRQLQAELRGLRTALLELDQSRSIVLSEFNRAVGKHARRHSGSLDEAAAALRLLEEALRRQALATKDCANCRERLAQLKTDSAALDRKIAGVFEGAGLSPEQEQLLFQCAGQLQAYRDIKQQLRDLHGRREWLQRQLEEKAPHLTRLSYDEIAQKQGELAAAAARRDALRDRLAGTARAGEDVRRGHRLEEALQREAAALNRLAAVQDQAFLAAAGGILLDQIDEEFRLESEPPVFREAARLFELFTSGSCRLLPALPQSEALGFRALEVQSGRELELHQLSRGTRMQLQLAARLAFAKAGGGAAGLPLVIDEALTASDPARFRAAAAALRRLAEEGRQVLYFSCRPAEAEIWKASAAFDGAPEPRILELASGKPVQVSLLTLAVEPAVPPVDGLSYNQYIRVLSPPALDPRLGASPAHLAHLMDDAELLHRLLTAGISCFGQLETLVGRGALDLFLDRGVFDQISARAAVLDAFKAARQIGRGRPLTPGIIERTCPTEAHLQAIIDKAEELHWDPKALTEAIDPDRGKAVKKLRRATYEEFAAALSGMGYLPDESPLNREQALAAVLAAVNPQIRGGKLTPPEVHRLFAALWELTEAES